MYLSKQPARRPAPGIARRALLAGATGGLGLAALGGCDSSAEPRWQPGPSGLVPVLAAAVYLADRYDVTIQALPELGNRLTPLREAHRVHITALTRELGIAESGVLPSGRPPAPVPSGSAHPSAGAAEPTAAEGPPRDAPSALAALRKLERAGEQQAAAACLAGPWYHASLLGSIAAARASHLELLT